MAQKWAIFISGRGSNLAAALEVPGIDVRLVVSSKPSAAGISKAHRSGVPVLVSRDWSEIDSELHRRKVDSIFLLGFMRILPENFVKVWEGRILNVHPSLLPKYPGLKSIERAIEDADECGVTIHEVSKGVDEGRILWQRRTLSASQVSKQRGDARSSEFIHDLVHIDEQSLVRSAISSWPPALREFLS